MRDDKSSLEEMYSLHLLCPPEDAEQISCALWEAGTVGIREIDLNENTVELIAAFEKRQLPDELRSFRCTWETEAETDWIAAAKASWPARILGEKLFLAPPWSTAPTPTGRLRIIHNPGLASGTGEHPCTQLALQALEQRVKPGCFVGDIGTGSGILSLAALRLGARAALAIDTDEDALRVARENAQLNDLPLLLAAGSADCLRNSCLDLLTANINAIVLLELADDLVRAVKPGGALILTGFQQYETATVREVFPAESIFEQDGWSALISISSRAAFWGRTV